jgi:hypothetical protein
MVVTTVSKKTTWLAGKSTAWFDDFPIENSIHRELSTAADYFHLRVSEHRELTQILDLAVNPEV